MRAAPRARLCAAGEALEAVLGHCDDLAGQLHAFALEPAEMVAILIEGDASTDAVGLVDVAQWASALVGPIPAEQTLCAIVITGRFLAEQAALTDSDADWSPSLIVGGDLVAQSLCLGGGQTVIQGELRLGNALYGHYNHGSLRVSGATRAAVILSSDFSMHFEGRVHCKNVLSSRGSLNIAAHHEDEALAAVLHPDLLNDYTQPIDALVVAWLGEGRSLLAAPARRSLGARLKALLPSGPPSPTKPPPLSVAGRERLARHQATIERGEPLQRLDVSACDLKAVPDELAAFSGVTEWALNGNRIGTLPDWMAQLAALEVLDISDCGLTRLPDWLGRLPSLRVLNASGNDLVEMATGDGAYPALERLHLGNRFSDSDAHLAWVAAQRLGDFPALTAFHLNLNVADELAVDADANAWFSETLAHATITPRLTQDLPTCFTRMPQLRSLDIQLDAEDEAAAWPVLSQLQQLEALQLSYGGVSDGYVAQLAAALPGTFVRHNGLSRRKTQVDVLMGEATADEVGPDVAALMGEKRWDEALAGADRLIAQAETGLPGVPAVELETPMKQKLRLLRLMARDEPDAARQQAAIQAAGAWAECVLARCAGLSTETVWRLGWDLGELRLEAVFTQAWRLIVGQPPEPDRAMALLDQIEVELRQLAPDHQRSAWAPALATLRVKALASA